MVFAVMALLAISAVQLLPWLHVRQIELAWPQPQLSAHALRRIAAKPWADRLHFAAEQLAADGWARTLCRELRDADGDGARLSLINETVGGLEHQLVKRRRWPQLCNRLTMLCGGLFLVLGLIVGARLPLLWIIPITAAGLMSGMLARRRGERGAKLRRVSIDAFVESLAWDLQAPQQLAAPRRRSWRYRRRRGH